MRRISSVLVLLLCVAGWHAAMAQALSPAEIKDPLSHQLQEKYWEPLKQVASEARAHHFPYPFYFSRILDVDQEHQRGLDQRSLRFDRYHGQTVLEITGNYYASYSSAVMDKNHRVRQTFFDVMLPLLQAAVPRFVESDSFQAYALEISHHVRRKVLGVDTENLENVVLLIPKAAAQRLVHATTGDEQQAAILDSQVFLDGQPFALWLIGDPPPGWEEKHQKELDAKAAQEKEVTDGGSFVETSAPEPTVSPRLLGLPEVPLKKVTAETLGNLEVKHQDAVARLVRELGPQAHFVSYAPPSFITFHHAAYLQLSMVTTLQARAASSRYKLAALAFDEHIAHLIRPTLSYFPPDARFDGIDFSTSVREAQGGDPLAVEFVFPMKVMRCYAAFDCTGQQLINSGFVLINGERADLQLQTAEDGKK
jgi:hypothetical protein